MIHKMCYVHGSKLSFILYLVHKVFASALSVHKKWHSESKPSILLNYLDVWHENLLLLLVFCLHRIEGKESTSAAIPGELQLPVFGSEDEQTLLKFVLPYFFSLFFFPLNFLVIFPFFPLHSEMPAKFGKQGNPTFLGSWRKRKTFPSYSLFSLYLVVLHGGCFPEPRQTFWKLILLTAKILLRSSQVAVLN